MDNRLRVLILEDQAPDAELIAHALRQSGMEIEWTRVDRKPDYLTALEAKPDIVLADFNVPGFGAFEALDVLREQGADVPVIVITGSLGDEVAAECIKRGASDYLLKDRLSRLRAAVEKALEGKQLRAETRQGERALRESEVKFRELIEQASDGIFVTDPQGNLKLVNPRFCEMLGYGEDELLRLNIEDTHVDADKALLARRLASLGEVKSRIFERTMRRRDGSLFPVEVSIRRLSTGLNQGIVRDITARKESERALRESEVKFRELIEQASDGIFATDQHGNFLLANPAYCEMLGYSEKELDQLNVAITFLEDERGAFPEQVAKLKETGSRLLGRTIRRKDGSSFPAEVSVRMLSNGTHQGMVRDITERNEAQQALAASEAGLRRAQLMAKLAQVTTGPDGSFESWSETLPQLMGIDSAQLPRNTREWLDLLHPDDRAMFRGKAIEAGVKGARTDIEYRLRRADGAWIYVRQVMEPLQGQTDLNGRQRWFNTMQDVTEQKEAEQKIRRLNRVHAVLSGINTLIVRVRDRRELFDETCRIAVEDGNFGMAWIGEFDRTTLEVTPVAWKGVEGDVTSIKASARGDIPIGQGIVGRAIRGKKPMITNDISADPGAGGSRRNEALRKGFQSIITMPLMLDGEVSATLTLFAKERNFFSEDELKLLTELASDISFALDHLAKAEQLAYVAYYDTLTGLPNRTLLLERLSQALHTAALSSSRLALMIGDVKRFRLINETLGRHAGDELLKQIAVRLPKNMRNPENLARIAGDSFATFLPDIHELSEVAHRIENLHVEAFQGPFTVEGQELMVSLSIGIAIYPNDGADAEMLFRNAEAALKKAKASGETYLFYEPSLNAKVAETLRLENKLRRAIEAEQFVLHYQPKVDATSGSIASVEALIRWQDPETGLVPPGRFIPLLEETGMILEVGFWAIRKALYDFARWRAAGLRAPRIAVNVSTIQLQQKDFVGTVKSIIDENRASNDVPGGGLDLEITESLIMRNIEEIIPRLKALRESGVDIMVDDFGTGHSSLRYLARLPITALKIDQSFVDTMSANAESMTIVSTIISLAHSLNLKVIAEGVETEDQAKVLRHFECDQLQGYLLGRPAPFDSVTALLPKAN